MVWDPGSKKPIPDLGSGSTPLGICFNVLVISLHFIRGLAGYVQYRYLVPCCLVSLSVADPDPGSGAFLTSGSGIRNI
jgi:hypothetical protein